MASSITTSEACHPLTSISLEGGLLGGTIMSGSSTGRLELRHPFHYSIGLQHYGRTIPHHLQGSASWSCTQQLNENQANNANAINHCSSEALPAVPFSKGLSSGTSDEDESSWKEATDEHHCEKGKQTSPWQRIKWTDKMVKLLINTVNFVGEDGSADNLDMNKRSVLQKKGKWRSVSNVMNKRGWNVSPQQCEDKFNDLNKRYKRLTDILGRDIALQVVDNIGLLDSLNSLTAKRKEDVKKILSSKHSFYKEMYSYHKGCKSPAGADFQFQTVIQSGKAGERCDAGLSAGSSMPAANVKEGLMITVRGDMEDSAFVNPHAESSVDGCDLHRIPGFVLLQPERSSDKEVNTGPDVLCATEDVSSSSQETNAVRFRLMQLEELKVSLQAQALEVQRQRYKWQKLSCKKNRELERIRVKNQKMNFENKQLTYQLKQKELEVECKRSVTSMALLDLVLKELKVKEQMQSMQGQGFG